MFKTTKRHIESKYDIASPILETPPKPMGAVANLTAAPPVDSEFTEADDAMENYMLYEDL